MGKRNSICQSCSMPLKKDLQGGGTNKDGSKSSLYCSLCFDAGEFRKPTMSMEEMKGFVNEKLKEMGLPAPLRWLFTRGFHKLKRWQE